MMAIGFCIGFLLFLFFVLLAMPARGGWNPSGLAVGFMVFAGGGATIGKLIELLA